MTGSRWRSTGGSAPRTNPCRRFCLRRGCFCGRMRVDNPAKTKDGSADFKDSNGDSITDYAGISFYSKSGDTTTFLLKKADDFFTVDIKETDPTGKVLTPRHVFTINHGYSDYKPQGVHFADNKIYVPLFGGDSNKNTNVVLVYNNIGNAIKNGTSPSLEKFPVFKKGDDPNALFEVEGCGFRNSVNPLWFNTNEDAPPTDGIYTDPRAIK